MINHLLSLASLRFYIRHPSQFVLAIIGISLGVAVYVGVDLANDSSTRAFEASSQMIRGSTTHHVLPVGSALDELVYRDLVLNQHVRAAPIVEASVTISELGDSRFTLLGLDPIGESGFRSYATFSPGGNSNAAKLLTEPGTVLVSAALLEDFDIDVGSTVTLVADGRRMPVEIVGTLPDVGAGQGAAGPIVADVSTAQELTGQIGTLSRIDLLLTDAEAQSLQKSIPPGTVLVPATSEDQAFLELTHAFQTNIRALGLLALVVGMFLIYATISFTVVQRRSSIGILRALGVSKTELLASILAETLVIGAIGTLSGIALGVILARLLVDMVLSTIGDFYFSSVVAAAAPSPLIYAQGLALGLTASVVASVGPLRDAMHVAPTTAIQRASFERSAKSRCRRGAVLAAPILVVATILLSIDTQSLLVAFAGIFMVLAGGAMLTPLITSTLVTLLEPLVDHLLGLSFVLALRNVNAHMSRVAVAIAALAIAVATVIGVGLMISSFRSSLSQWLHTTLTADIYLTFGQSGDDGAAAALIEAIEQMPDVAGVSRTRFVSLPTEQGAISVRAFEPGQGGWGLNIVDGDSTAALSRIETEAAIIIAEPLAYRRGLHRGDYLELPTASGPQRFPIVGIYRDYNTTAGAAVMSLATYRRLWRDSSITGLGIIADRRADVSMLAERLTKDVPLPATTRLRTTSAIRELSLQIFDRTFQITEVLRVLAAIVAFLGILSAILAIQLERIREFAVLRSMGFSPRDLCKLILAETGTLGAAAGLSAVPIGCVLAALLVFVINRRSFGWTMDMAIDPEPVVFGMALAIGAAILAGLVPSLRAARGRLAAALRDE